MMRAIVLVALLVLRVAGLATLQQAFLGKCGRESQNNPVKKKPHARATVHAAREVVGTDF